MHIYVESHKFVRLQHLLRWFAARYNCPYYRQRKSNILGIPMPYFFFIYIDPSVTTRLNPRIDRYLYYLVSGFLFTDSSLHSTYAPYASLKNVCDSKAIKH